ncbi:MAG TPA: TIGR01777 family oxidoreductase [Pseudoxanthomonas sp.]|nr:TIGR01777 family oxidoreductase [Pseudoxanthomonas sp.]
MQVLVTGGSGFIGRALCQQLLQAGHHPIVLTRDAQAAARRLPGVRLITALDELERADAVVNLAGESLTQGRWNDHRKQAFRDSRIGTTRRLLAWLEQRQTRPAVLVSGSAIGYYGPRDDTPLDETAAPGSDFAAQLCRDWEAEAAKAADLGLRVCLLRTGIVLAADGGALGKMLPPFRLGLGGPMGNGRQWMSWVHRADLVRLIIWLIEHDDGSSGAYNATAPQPVTNREFAHTLGRVLRRPALLATPGPALKLMFGEMADLLLTGQRVVPQRAQAAGFEFGHRQLEEALRDLLE